MFISFNFIYVFFPLLRTLSFIVFAAYFLIIRLIVAIALHFGAHMLNNKMFEESLAITTKNRFICTRLTFAQNHLYGLCGHKKKHQK